MVTLMLSDSIVMNLVNSKLLPCCFFFDGYFIQIGIYSDVFTLFKDNNGYFTYTSIYLLDRVVEITLFNSVFFVCYWGFVTCH
jgi:hypothetical protein